MGFVISVGLSLAFGLFWMWWYYRQDVYDKEPKRFVALIFVLSMPLSVLAGLLEYILDQSLNHVTESGDFLASSLFYFGVVAVLEELAKFFVVFTVAYPNKAFNEPVDGIIYAAAAALGFATFENAFYVLDKGPLVLLLRGPFSTLGHVLFSALWGASLGLARQEVSRRKKVQKVGTGLLQAILAHGAYNSLIAMSYPGFSNGSEWLGLSGILFLVALYFVVSYKIGYALRISAFNPRNSARQAIQRIRERRGASDGEIAGANVPVISSESERESSPRYAPNPFRYRSQGRYAPESSVETPTIKCPHCGASNLADEETTRCYNCGRLLNTSSESRS
ncbi:MAG TPA: PrsW family intramembrane metalloprotease [Chloroflexia bacterium]|nr:PrsW family intramembrane metalloprotease [Chloroflexia bacterium]